MAPLFYPSIACPTPDADIKLRLSHARPRSFIFPVLGIIDLAYHPAMPNYKAKEHRVSYHVNLQPSDFASTARSATTGERDATRDTSDRVHYHTSAEDWYNQKRYNPETATSNRRAPNSTQIPGSVILSLNSAGSGSNLSILKPAPTFGGEADEYKKYIAHKGDGLTWKSQEHREAVEANASRDRLLYAEFDTEVNLDQP